MIEAVNASAPVEGRAHSIQSMGTLDGPGVRFVLFMQGCPLRCACCHNPDTWAFEGGITYTAEELVQKATRYRSYFGAEGGVTVSGGEPLMQADFVRELFRLCHAEGIHTCLDTSGCILNDGVRALLGVTDRVLLDIKYTTDEDYRAHVGCGMDTPLAFLACTEEMGIPVTLRQVIIPTLNDTPESIAALGSIARAYKNVDKVELLPFRKLCTTKYDAMGIPFPLAHVPEPTRDAMTEAERWLEQAWHS